MKIAKYDPTGLISSKRTIRVKFVLKDPFVGDNIGTRQRGDERPSAILKKSNIFFLHSTQPIEIFESTTVGRRDMRQGSCDGRKVETINWSTKPAGYWQYIVSSRWSQRKIFLTSN